MKPTRRSKPPQVSAKALREFAENRRIANKAVQKAIEENRKAGVSDKMQFAD